MTQPPIRSPYATGFGTVSVWPTFVRRRGGARSLRPRAVGGEAFAATAIRAFVPLTDPEDKAPVSFQRPNARPQPADVHGEKYFQGNTSDGESDTDNGHEHGRGVAPALGYSRTLCDGDDPDSDDEAHGDAEEAEEAEDDEDDEACRAAFGKVIAS